ncbi:hypothetical protein Hanom_Chr09g00851221 [Helianthus anomalus]
MISQLLFQIFPLVHRLLHFFSESTIISANMSTSSKPRVSKKRQSKPKDPPVPNHAVSLEWGVQYPTVGSTALNAPPGYMTLYAAFFREGNFRLSMTKFLGEVLPKYGLHISQINALGLPRVTHFEFICRAQTWILTVEMFNVFYYVTNTGGFYSFNSRTTNVLPCIRDPPKSFHDWKNKFFYILRGFVIGGSYADQDWYKTLTRVPTAIVQLEEKDLFAAGMSTVWVPKDPRAAPVYAFRGKGYSLMNVLDPKVGCEMTGAHFFVKPEVGKPPTREEAILLSSEESVGSSHGLINRSTRAGLRAQLIQSSEGATASTPSTAEPVVVTFEPKKKESEKKEPEKKEFEKKESAGA